LCCSRGGGYRPDELQKLGDGTISLVIGGIVTR
jgi:hypothetical protein